MNAPAVTSEEVSIAVLSAKIDALTETVHEIKTSMSETRESHVTRQEWQLRNDFVDERARRLQAEIESRRAPWWSVLAIIAAFGALAWNIFGPVLTR